MGGQPCVSHDLDSESHGQVQTDQTRGEREEDPQHGLPPLHSEDDQLQRGHQIPLLCPPLHPWRGTLLSP